MQLNNMNTYEKIREIRNNKLYDGMPPLEFGCEAEFNKQLAKVIRVNESEGVIEKGLFVWLEKDKTAINQSADQFEILGKPVSLNDVLRMLPDTKENKNDCAFYKTGSNCSFVFETGDLDIDLSKDIKHQSEETLLAILKLIEK